MIHIPYLGSGPYCYSSSLAMMMGADAPEPAVIETVTGSPFGMQLVGGTLPFFDPYGWTPETGVEDALTALGWTARTLSGGDADSALDRLASLLEGGPVMVGPVEMGHLRYQPGKTGPIGADHYLIALDVEGDHITLHDPQGYPYAQLPLTDFMDAWRADTVEYGRPYTMRTGFTRVTDISATTAVTATLPRAITWLTADPELPAPPGSLANGQAALALADRLDARDEELREHLIHFAVRVGARRLADAATCLRRVGCTAAAATLARQARLVGALQHPLATGDTRTAAQTLRALAPTYDILRTDLEHTLATASPPTHSPW
ncbi:hypothetical protein [Nonomuraea africana]|uniref:RADC family protein n=1 Tax=Nonomuraea africana TaxID=46171 RepID=A0ABR9KC48_9ACTN|nr:hypothetical protein [Nonomuraea africana]MBE1559582.1 hypothetical protein [Nonomuraea africana]